MHLLVIPSWYPDCPSDIGGSFFREQAIALCSYGIQVGVIAPRLRSLRDWHSLVGGSYGLSVETDEGVATFRHYGINFFPRLWECQSWLWLRAGRKLFQHYAAAHGYPDVIQAHSMLNAGLLAQEIHRLYGIPYVVTEHSSAFARNLLSTKQLSMAKLVAADAAKTLAVSEPFCELLEDRLGAEAGQWECIPNIVSSQFLDRPLKSRGLPTISKDKPFRFICVALLTENKGVDNLIRAFADAFRGVSNVELLIGGDGPARRSLEGMAGRLGVTAQLTFLGQLTRDQVVDAIESADAFVLASRYETFGVVVIEALALGKPVVATRCGGPESIVREDDGILVPVDDSVSLAKAMQKILAEVGRYSPDTLRERCRSRYGEVAIARQLAQVYDRASIKAFSVGDSLR